MIDSLYKFVYSLVKNKELAEDITTETFIKATKNRDKFKGGNYKNWLFTIAHNLVIDHYRKTNKVTNISNISETQKQTFAYTENFKDKALIADIYKALNNLKLEYKSAIILRYIYGFSYQEISRILNKSEQAVRQLVSRGLKKIRLYINSHK